MVEQNNKKFKLNNNGSLKNKILFLLIGIALLVGGILLLVTSISFNKNSDIVEAKVLKIEVDNYSDDEIHYITTIEYKVDGIQYTNKITDHIKSNKVGKIIKIRYDHNDHMKIRYGNNYILAGIVLLVMGGIVTSITFLQDSEEKNDNYVVQ